MKALTWQGISDVSVDEVPDPQIVDPTDIIVRITSTGLCGSDLHLYTVMAPFLDAGDILGHEPMGIVEEVGPEVTALQPGRPGRDPVQRLLRRLLDVRARPALAVRDDAGARVRHRRLAVRLHQALRPGARAARPSTCGCRSATPCRSRSPTARPTTASCSSPTCCPPRGRAWSTRRCPTADRWSCSASGRSATWRPGSPPTAASA